jgi:hypothetical protein
MDQIMEIIPIKMRKEKMENKAKEKALQKVETIKKTNKTTIIFIIKVIHKIYR